MVLPECYKMKFDFTTGMLMFLSKYIHKQGQSGEGETCFAEAMTKEKLMGS